MKTVSETSKPADLKQMQEAIDQLWFLGEMLVSCWTETRRKQDEEFCDLMDSLTDQIWILHQAVYGPFDPEGEIRA